MGFNLHADNSNDPPEVRNWRVHLIALVVSMGALASKSLFLSANRIQLLIHYSGL